MPADLNRATLVGRLTRDPDLRHTATGDPVTTLRLAFSSRAKDAAGEWGERSNYIDITLFGTLAEVAARHLVKGRRVGVDGRLSWHEWEAADGGRRQAVEVVAGDIFFLDAPRPAGEPTATADTAA